MTARRINLSKEFAQWNPVEPEYLDAVGDPVYRDHPGWGSEHYVNQSGRNDIVAAKVAYDSKNVSFYVRSKYALSPRTDPNWMMLFVNVGGTYRKGWLGYDFVVNRRPGPRSPMSPRQDTRPVFVGFIWSC